tara:strand:- start:120 stop:530 length:411 start_codon:yes stop_codon:yes gene_type:complete
MAYTIVAARNPQWTNADHNAIDLEVNFEELDEEWLPYTSSAQDVCEHSRSLYTRAAAGEFGAVSTEYVITEDDLWTPQTTTVTEVSSEALVQVLLEKGIIDDDDVDSILVDNIRALGFTRPTKDGSSPNWHSPMGG